MSSQTVSPSPPPPPPPVSPPSSTTRASLPGPELSLPPSSYPPPQILKTYSLTASSISYTKPTDQPTILTSLLSHCTAASSPNFILRNVSFTAHPSQVLAIVGPSGAGKSTLLDILAARTAPTAGSLLLNSAPVHPPSFRKLCAYVPQHDASLPLLTVSETFNYAARLLFPSRRSHQLHSLVASILSELRLSHLADALLASGLSGGERRRVSIGLSLLHDPAILLLDEPTSGLDSASAYHVLQTLRSVAASRHRTVVLSIHQPSYRILSTIDSLLLLCRGTVVHHGNLSSLELFLLSRGFTLPPQLNALEYAMDILNQLHDQTSPSPSSDDQPPPQPIPSKKNSVSCVGYSSSRFNEISTLSRRFWKIIYRTKQLLLANTIEAVGVGILLGTIYINIGFDMKGIEKRLGLFAFTLTFLLSSTTETLPVFVSERPILLRETSSGIYRVSSHLIANTIVFLPYLLAIAFMYSVSVYFLVGLCASWQAFAYFVLVIWVVVLMANSFVLFLSSIAPNYIAGTSLVTVCLAGFFLFSGYFISKDSIPGYWLFMHYFSLYKYALDALLINEYSCLASRCFVRLDGTEICAVTGRDVLQLRGLHERQRWTNVQVMVGFFVFYRVLCLVVLKRRASISKK
ncbi:unnamed protein product [Victoria cruziana]